MLDPAKELSYPLTFSLHEVHSSNKRNSVVHILDLSNSFSMHLLVVFGLHPIQV